MSEGWTRVGSTVYRGVLISEGWTRVAPLYTEVSSCQRFGLEWLHCIQRCPQSEGWTRVGSTVYRGVLMSEVWTRVAPLYTEVSSVRGLD